LDDNNIDRLGMAAFSRSIEPLRRAPQCRWPVVGFDTEYTSKSNKLICFTLWHNDRGVCVEVLKGDRLTPKWLYHETAKLLHDAPSDILLVTYFSLAELQFLPVVSEGFRIFESANGSLDVTFAAENSSLHIFDLARWFDRQGLDRAARAMGFEGKKSQDVTKVTRACMRSHKFRDYAIHDARLCHDVMQKLREVFIENTEIDPIMAKTPANASAQAFRRMKIRRKFFCDSNRIRYVALRCAWGGRAEVFKRGRLAGMYEEWDFASAYPRAGVCLERMPIQGVWRPFASLREARRMLGGFVRVRFVFDRQTAFPCLPVNTGDRNIYPLEGESWCTLAEAREAERLGAHLHILEGWGYSDGTPALSEYLKWTLSEREKATGAGKVLFKLLGNALIGKFAQQVAKIPINEYYRLAEELDVYLDELFELSKDEITALGASEHISVGSVFMPEWNALITGYTRAALSKMLTSSDPIYCHTDSVWTKTKPKCDMLPFDRKISGRAVIVRARFAGLGKLTAKSAKAGESHIAHHSIWNLQAACQMLSKFNGADFTRTYPVRRPLKFREAVKGGRNPGIWVIEWRRGQTKWDNQRKLLENGRDTAPWANIQEYLAARK